MAANQMYKDWLITNFKIRNRSELITISDKVQLYTADSDTEFIQSFENDLTILCQGYVILQTGIDCDVNPGKNIPLIKELYLKYGDKFVKYVKGIFTVVIVDGSVFKVFNDQLGISKYFYYIDGEAFAVSSSIKEIQQLVKSEFDYDNVAVYLLLNYFVLDTTCFKGIKKSVPALMASYVGELDFTRYWDIHSLITDIDKAIDYKHVSDKLIEILKHSISDLEIQKPCVTLTGGLDSRLLLALFFKSGIRPDVVSYGNPNSEDVKTAKFIALKYNLSFHNPDPAFTDHKEFDEVSTKIIESGQTLASIYRANRLQSIKNLMISDIGVDSLFGGYMGGEVIRGLHYEQMIFSEGLYMLWEEGAGKDVLVKFYKKNFIEYEKFDLDKILGLISESGLLPKDGRQKDAEFNVVFNVAASLHHSQDINLYRRSGMTVIPLFLDLDYLKYVFASGYSFLFRNNLSANQLKRIDIQDFHCNLIKILDPDLARINFNYGYSANLYLKSKFLYVAKRVLLKISGKKHLPLFRYGDWYITFLIEKLSEGKKGELKNIFNFDKMVSILEKGEPIQKNESTLLPFTKAVNMELINNIYESGGEK